MFFSWLLGTAMSRRFLRVILPASRLLKWSWPPLRWRNFLPPVTISRLLTAFLVFNLGTLFKLKVKSQKSKVINESIISLLDLHYFVKTIMDRRPP